MRVSYKKLWVLPAQKEISKADLRKRLKISPSTLMVLVFLSPTSGIINHFIKMIGFEPVNFMQEYKWFVPVYVISGIWQGTGWSSILYLASLSGIDVSQYEAAKIDGASNWRIMWQINLPAIVPTIQYYFRQYVCCKRKSADRRKSIQRNGAYSQLR